MSKHLMIVCINHDPAPTSEPPRSKIEYLNYDTTDYPELTMRAGSNLAPAYDETYVIEIDPLNQEFIEEIRKYGQRMHR